MPYILSFQDKDGYLRVEGRGNRAGTDPLKSGMAALKTIITRCRDGGQDRIMMISHLTGHYPPYANFQVVASMDQLDIPREWKMAYVNLDPESHKAVLFSETLAIKKGFQARVFDNEPDAYEWLMRDTQSDMQRVG